MSGIQNTAPDDAHAPASGRDGLPVNDIKQEEYVPLSTGDVPQRTAPNSTVIDTTTAQPRPLKHALWPYAACASQAGAARVPAAAAGPVGPLFSEARAYIADIKAQFADDPAVYERFLDIVEAKIKKEIDEPTTLERVSALFAGHPSLLKGFSAFLTPVPSVTPGALAATPSVWPAVDHKVALRYRDVVKAQLADDPATYVRFIQILKEIKESPDAAPFVDRVFKLFAEYPELIRGFNVFVPAGYEIQYP